MTDTYNHTKTVVHITSQLNCVLLTGSVIGREMLRFCPFNGHSDLSPTLGTSTVNVTGPYCFKELLNSLVSWKSHNDYHFLGSLIKVNMYKYNPIQLSYVAHLF